MASMLFKLEDINTLGIATEEEKRDHNNSKRTECKGIRHKKAGENKCKVSSESWMEVMKITNEAQRSNAEL